MKSTKGEKIFYFINYIILITVTLVCILPFINTIAVSFSSERAVISGEVVLWPVEPSLDTYKVVLTTSPIIPALKNTILVSLLGTAINMIITILAAYSLSKHRLKLRSFFLIAITFTMMFDAGMIPNFLLVKSLGLLNSYWALWLPGAISTFNMIVLKTFFQNIPDSLEESAMIDGATDLTILFRIVIPLSAASLATIALFYAVGHWNSYMSVLIYITKSELFTLQVRLRQLLLDSSVIAQMNNITETSNDVFGVAEESLKGASIVIATLPILLVYPFLQKYFVKGVMIGSVKG